MECIAKTKVHNVRRVEKEKKMPTISREMLKIVTFPRAKTDGCEKCVSPTRETRNHEKWASGAGKSVVDFVHEPNSPISAAPLFRLLGSPRDTLGYAGGALAPPGALKVRSKTRKCRSWVIKMGFSCRRGAHYEKTNFLQREPTQSEFHCAFENELFVQARKPFWSTWARSRLACGALGVTRGSKMRL